VPKKVTIIAIDAATVPGPSAEEMAENLKLHGIVPNTITLKGDNRTAGSVILDRARALGCDLVVKGAYTQSRLRQLIFGGTTRHILTHAELPVLTAH
jgi:nucleotide-binding universal stress UspA family protein